MTPTPEQVAQWAREAGFGHEALVRCFLEEIHAIVLRAMAAQAEADAVLCVPQDCAHRCGVGHEFAQRIRANAPKVNT